MHGLYDDEPFERNDMANKAPSSAGINVEEMLRSMGLDPVEVTDENEGALLVHDEADSAQASKEAGKSLDEILEQARFEAAVGMTNPKRAGGTPALLPRNVLFDERSKEMAELIEILARFAPLSGRARGYGFLNVLNIVASKVDAGELDDLAIREYNQIVRDGNELGKLWEGEVVVQGFPLVRNAMFYIMLNDLDLFETVYLRTLEWLEACARHLEESGVSLK